MSLQIGGTVVRLWNVYGPIEETTLRSHVVCDLLRKAIENKRVILRSDGCEMRKFIHIQDVCRLLLLSITYSSDIFDAGNLIDWIQIGELAAIIYEILDLKEIEFGTEKSSTFIPDPHVSPPGWTPVICIEDGIREMVKQLL